MAAPFIDREQVARILVDAIALGEKTACDKWKISLRTLARHRKRAASDPELAELVRAKGRVAEEHWSLVRVRFLRKAIAKLEQLVDCADSDAASVRAVAEAVKVVGELQVAAAVLNEPGTDQQGARPAEAATAVAIATANGNANGNGSVHLPH